ncbi:glycoside hydrolase family 20 protein [uncultured Bacteroides sp.]|uniref:glycoside hydrolase family 20 protein n=1 Tax=uncultured Bacteroides sp. TaxID=162156 RepID=UPI002AA6FECA|nr:glycoside hydrolase family 20 protein [uncultured Bacteroides sp.]
MKKKIKFLLLLCLFISPGCIQAKEVVNEYNLVPLPNRMIPQKGRFKLTDKVIVITPESPKIRPIADSLITRLQLTSGITLQQTSKERTDVPDIKFIEQAGFAKEAYKLSVSPKRIIITASEPNGFFYAVQTLYQLMPAAIYGNELKKEKQWSIPAVEIEDAPRFAYRGLMLDVCRHFSSVEYIHKFIDMLALHKMNTFHWHLTDDQGWRIEIKKYPKLVQIGSKRKESLVGYYFENYPQVFDGKEHSGYYTQEQIKSIVAYAASKYITVIPEIEMPGHALAAIASYPELSCKPDTTYEVTGTWGVFDQVYCPTEKTFKFLEDVLDEVMNLFPSQYIHIGGDECPKTAWEKSEYCQTLIKKLGLKDDVTPNLIDGKKHTKEEKLQSYFITRMEKYLNSKGRNIIGWDEILEGGLAPNATVMSWRGVEGGINAAKAGHDAIMTPGTYVYLDHYQEDPEFAPTTIGGYTTMKNTYNYNPVPDNADDLVKKHIIGLQGNIWTEYMSTDERKDYQTYPRAAAIAESAWTLNRNKDWNNFRQRMTGDFQRMDVMHVKACRNFFNVNINTHADKEGLLKVVLETDSPNATIHYTTNGSNPTVNSSLYAQPFPLKEYIHLKAAVFKEGKMLGDICTKKLYGNLISGKKYTVTPHPGWMTGDIFGENDVLGADSTTFGLTNGKRGNNASYTPWVSFKMDEACNNEVIFAVDLKEPQKISKIIFGTLFNPAYKVLPAKEAIVEVSTNGTEYKRIAEKNFVRQLPKNGRKAYTNSLTFEPTSIRYIKLTIKNGGMLRNGIDCRKDSQEEAVPGDLFLDEIEVY